MRLIAIAAIALSPAVVFGQSRTHIRVTKDGTHSSTTQQSTNGDVYTAPAPAPAAAPAPADTATPAPAPAAEPAPAPAPEPTPAPADTTAPKTDSTQLGTGAVAPTPTHSQQTDSAMTTDSTMRTDSTTSSSTTTTPVDTVRVQRPRLSVSPLDSAKMGIPATRQTQAADSARRAAADSTAATTPPPR